MEELENRDLGSFGKIVDEPRGSEANVAKSSQKLEIKSSQSP